MTTSLELPKKLRIGSLIATIAGAFPVIVGLTLYITVQISALNPDQPWKAAQIPPGPMKDSVTLNQIKAWNSDLGQKFHVGEHIQYTNVMNAGAAVMILSWFGLRSRLKWAWWGALGIGLWIGLNDAITTLLSGQLPIPLIPTILVIIGLFIARPEIFKKD